MGNEQSTQTQWQKTNGEKTAENGELNGHAVPTPDEAEPVASKVAEVEQKSEDPPVTITNEPKPPQKEEVDGSKLNGPPHVETTPEQKMPVAKDAERPKANVFGKMFKKKSEHVKPASENNDSVDAQITELDLETDVLSTPVNIKTSTEPEPEPEPEPEGEALEPSPVEVTEENNPPADIKAAENTVMNFFKAFTSPTKTSKEAKATPDASKEQSQKETPPAPSTNVQETPKVPPPPPPAPPKMESKVEPAVKKEETSATKAAAAAETKAQDSPKIRSDSPFRKLFRPKSVVVEDKNPVEVQVDASKSSTLEAAAKPEEPPAPKPEEKKPEKKTKFGNMFKPKAPEPKQATPAPPPVAEAAPVVKAKEEPKPAAPAPQTAPDNKSVGSTEASPNMPRKLEKRNSIQLFFKTLGQKRHSDAGVQTEPAAPEKSK